MKWKSYLTISLITFECLPDEDGKKVDAKNKDQDEKTERMNLSFKFSISKLGYMTIFIKI